MLGRQGDAHGLSAEDAQTDRNLVPYACRASDVGLGQLAQVERDEHGVDAAGWSRQRRLISDEALTDEVP